MEWETIVNQHSNAKKHNKRRTRRNLYLRRAVISGVVGIAFVLATLTKLAHPVLGESGMVIAICVAWYNLGRAKECA